MYCRNCGARLDEGTGFCRECGASVNERERSEPKPTDMGLIVMIIGIASLFMAVISVTPVGIVLGIVGIVLWKKSEPEQILNPTYMKVGSILSIVGLIVNAALLVYGIIVAAFALSATFGLLSGVFEGLRSTMH